MHALGRVAFIGPLVRINRVKRRLFGQRRQPQSLQHALADGGLPLLPTGKVWRRLFERGQLLLRLLRRLSVTYAEMPALRQGLFLPHDTATEGPAEKRGTGGFNEGAAIWKVHVRLFPCDVAVRAGICLP